MVVDLQRQASPIGQLALVEPRRVAGEHHLAVQRLQQAQQCHMRGIVKVVPVAALRAPRCLQIRRIAVHQFAALEGEGFQEAQPAPPVQFHRIVAGEAVNGTGIQIDADVALRGKLPLQDRAAAQKGFDIHIMRRLRGNDRLAEP